MRGGTVGVAGLLPSFHLPPLEMKGKMLNGTFDSDKWNPVTGSGASGLVADYWTPWWAYRPGKNKIWWNAGDDNGYLQPEFCRGEAPPPGQIDKVPRWLGKYSQGWFGVWKVSVAGVYQVVPTIPGRKYRLTAMGMGWSNDGGTDQNAHNPRWSEGAGTQQYYKEADSNWPEIKLIGNPQVDAMPNLLFQLGVLPSGNPLDLTNPAGKDVRDMLSPRLIRGKGAHTYNVWHELPAVEFTATSERALVVLVGANMWGFMHTHWYFDNVALEIIDVPVEPPVPPPVNYVVVVNLLPQNATKAEKACVLDAVHDSKQTILQSADDAKRLVLPGKLGSKVVTWGGNERWPGITTWLAPCIVESKPFPKPGPVPPMPPANTDKHGLHLRSGGDGIQDFDLECIKASGIGRGKVTTEIGPGIFDKLVPLGIDPAICVVRLFSAELVNCIVPPDEYCGWFIQPVKDYMARGVRVFEVHNEPNLAEEWCGTAAQFADWYGQVLDILHRECPGALIGFPGLSPQPNVDEWLNICASVIRRSDWSGIHCYWRTPGQIADPANGKYWERWTKRFPGLQLVVTEFSNNDPAVNKEMKGAQYVAYWKQLPPEIEAAFCFISSSDTPAFAGEAWADESGRLSEIPYIVGKPIV